MQRKPQKYHRCEYINCAKRFKNLEKYENHISWHKLRQQIFPCNICNLVFATEEDREEHCFSQEHRSNSTKRRRTFIHDDEDSRTSVPEVVTDSQHESEGEEEEEFNQTVTELLHDGQSIDEEDDDTDDDADVASVLIGVWMFDKCISYFSRHQIS
jgi:hypothetical protein